MQIGSKTPTSPRTTIGKYTTSYTNNKVPSSASVINMCPVSLVVLPYTRLNRSYPIRSLLDPWPRSVGRWRSCRVCWMWSGRRPVSVSLGFPRGQCLICKDRMEKKLLHFMNIHDLNMSGLFLFLIWPPFYGGLNRGWEYITHTKSERLFVEFHEYCSCALVYAQQWGECLLICSSQFASRKKALSYVFITGPLRTT